MFREKAVVKQLLFLAQVSKAAALQLIAEFIEKQSQWKDFRRGTHGFRICWFIR